MDCSLLLINGQLINPKTNQPFKAHLLIKDGLIAKIGATKSLRAKQMIDLKGKVVLPGLIDSHVHFRSPGLEYKEDFATGSKAALAGGVTTVLEMPNTIPPTIDLKTITEKQRIAQKKSLVSLGFHLGLSKTNYDELLPPSFWSKYNVVSLKIYFGSSFGDMLFNDLKKLKRLFKTYRGLITVHSEDENIIQKNIKRWKKVGTGRDLSLGDLFVPSHHLVRTKKAAIIATKKLLKLVEVTNHPLYFCHITTKEEMEMLKEAKRKGLPVFMEVTPHHLFLTEEHLKTLDNFGKVNPPLRGKGDQKALFKAIKENIVDTIASDHAPHTREEKQKPYFKAPAGLPGIETMLPLLLDAVNKKRLTLSKVIELTSQNPSLIFGLKNKGQIQEGYEADLTVIDINLTKEVRNETLQTKCGWSPYHGWRLKGWPVMTIVGGKIVFCEKYFLSTLDKTNND